MNNISKKNFYYFMKTIFFKVCSEYTTLKELCDITQKSKEEVIQILSVLNNRLITAYSGIDKYLTISVLQNEGIALSCYPTTYIGKHIKIRNYYEIDQLFSSIMNDKYYASKLTYGDTRPLWYYSHTYNKKSDEFSDDILKEFNFK